MIKKYNFALIGAAGYIAPRHLKAIKDTNNNLIAAFDPFDSVGIMDKYFPEADFFVESERFDRHLDKLRRYSKNRKVDFVSICSPNYLHDSHIRIALRNDAHAICEKPIVLNPWNLDALQIIEKETGKKVYTILQLRLHPVIAALREEMNNNRTNKILDIDLSYITSRGNWYFISWKGHKEKSGGIATNIGVHFFDMLSYVFGDVKGCIVNYSDDKKASGLLDLKKARVRWFLSLDENDIPLVYREKGQKTFRSIKINNNEIEFSSGFTDLHSESYINIINGKGFCLEDARTSINTVFQIRNATPIGLIGDYHPFLKRNKK